MARRSLVKGSQIVDARYSLKNEMAKRIRAFPWDQTNLGPINSWPQSLITAVNLVLQSPLPLVMLWGKDGIMIYNDAYSDFAGARHPFLLGSKVVEGWPEVADFNRNVMKHGLAGKTLSYKDQQLVLYRNNVPEDVWMNLNYSPIIDESGKPGGVLAIVIETTQQVLAIQKQKEAEKALEIERDRLRVTFMQAPAAIAIMRGENHIFELANSLYMKLVGEERQLIGKTIREGLPELKGQGFYELLDNVYKSGQPFIGNEVPAKLKRSGKLDLLYFNFIYQPIRDGQGKVEGVFVHAVDVTEQAKSKQRIEELSRQKDDFLGIASHELKTPVTSIKAYGQVLQKAFAKEGNTKAVTQLQKMDRQINKLALLISDLLDVTKIQSGKLVMQEEKFDLTKLVLEIVEELQRTTDRHKLKTSLPPIKNFYGDRERIGQVLSNLISNAIKYSPNGKDIRIKLEEDKNNLLLSVRDTGVGIPKDKLDKVFEQFFRVDKKKQYTFPGLGLGLYISSEIIKRHQGKIWVKSAEGKGATFYVMLPGKKRGKV